LIARRNLPQKSRLRLMIDGWSSNVANHQRLVMRSIVVAALCSCALVFSLSAAPAWAGDYGATSVWYSSSCCYQKLVRHQRDVIYYRAGALQPYYAAYPYPYVGYVEPHRVVRFSEFDYYSRFGDYGHAGCYWKKVPIRDWRGGWVWGVKTTCY
jgi:hypothetical protein